MQYERPSANERQLSHSPLSPEDALEFYGYDIMYMLYSAMREYALAQEDVLDAVNLTLGCLQQMDEKQP